MRSDLFELAEQRPSLEAASIEDTESVPPEDRVDLFRDKEEEDTPLHILTSGIIDVTVTKDDIATLLHEGIVVDDNNDPAPENVCTPRTSYLPPRHSTSDFKALTLGVRVGTYLLVSQS